MGFLPVVLMGVYRCTLGLVSTPLSYNKIAAAKFAAFCSRFVKISIGLGHDIPVMI